MTTFKQYLVEQDDTEVTGAGMAKQIRFRCKPYLATGGGTEFNLYRGMQGAEQRFIVKRTRQDRRPMNTSVQVQQLLDQWFVDNFGHPYRSNAVYASGDHDHATMYSDNVYRIFPVGQFNFVWSPDIDDLYMTMGRISLKMRQAGYDTDEANFRTDDITDAQKKFIYQFLEDAQYTDSSLQKAAGSGHEIMIATNKYIAVDNNVAQSEKLEYYLGGQ